MWRTSQRYSYQLSPDVSTSKNVNVLPDKCTIARLSIYISRRYMGIFPIAQWWPHSPLVGYDPIERERKQHTVNSRKAGPIIVLSSHYIPHYAPPSMKAHCVCPYFLIHRGQQLYSWMVMSHIRGGNLSGILLDHDWLRLHRGGLWWFRVQGSSRFLSKKSTFHLAS